MARFVEGCSPRIRDLVAARAKRAPPAPPVQAQPMHSLALHKPPAQSHLAAPRPLVMPGPSIGSSSIPPQRCGRHMGPCLLHPPTTGHLLCCSGACGAPPQA